MAWKKLGVFFERRNPFSGLSVGLHARGRSKNNLFSETAARNGLQKSP
jgi:hypothetical protein